MIFFQSFLLGYLVNSIWQAPLIFLIAKGLARLTAKCGPPMHHRLWVATLLLQAVLPASFFSPLAMLHVFLGWLPFAPQSPASGRVTILSGEGTLHGTIALPGPLLVSLAVLYLATCLYFATAFAWSLRKTHHLRRTAPPFTLAGPSQTQWNVLRDRFRVPEATLAACSSISGPITIGIRHRLILLPPVFETALSLEDQAVALAHECAHMQRRDFAKNLLYQVVSLPIAYHPALRATLARIAETREVLCDVLAAQAVEGPRRYARSLLRLAAIFAPTTRTPYAIGIFDANPSTLETRIMTLTAKTRSLGRLSRIAIGTLSAAILLATCASAMALRMEIGAPAGSPAPYTNHDAPTQSAQVSSSVMVGNLIRKIPPVYPQSAREAKISGAVRLSAVIGKDGTVERLTVESGPGELRASALDAVRQWLYKPYLLNGKPTEVQTTITITYSLQN